MGFCCAWCVVASVAWNASHVVPWASNEENAWGQDCAKDLIQTGLFSLVLLTCTSSPHNKVPIVITCQKQELAVGCYLNGSSRHDFPKYMNTINKTWIENKISLVWWTFGKRALIYLWEWYSLVLTVNRVCYRVSDTCIPDENIFTCFKRSNHKTNEKIKNI